jgi:hypothetical protein
MGFGSRACVRADVAGHGGLQMKDWARELLGLALYDETVGVGERVVARE